MQIFVHEDYKNRTRLMKLLRNYYEIITNMSFLILVTWQKPIKCLAIWARSRRLCLYQLVIKNRLA